MSKKTPKPFIRRAARSFSRVVVTGLTFSSIALAGLTGSVQAFDSGQCGALRLSVLVRFRACSGRR